jgi:hypothetical protein
MGGRARVAAGIVAGGEIAREASDSEYGSGHSRFEPVTARPSSAQCKLCSIIRDGFRY